MPPLRLLCLHGSGTNVDIFQSQIGAISRELARDDTAHLHFVEGEVETAAGPGIEGFYEGPYLSFHAFPPTSNEHDEATIQAAYEMLYTIMEEEGPFDGILGYSHGGTLAYGFLAQHLGRFPYDPPFRCAIFFNAPPPFHAVEGKMVIRTELHKIPLIMPTLHVTSKSDYLYQESLELYSWCDVHQAVLVLHEKGHAIPNDPKSARSIGDAIRKLGMRAMAG
ncbi:hypothetical protein ASPZODRAFT_158255 [Penicilliopsis zonata CBS 506.65]|uniref:Serine hydrolase domain-containing protein n=1 Tax=Penicilliopsis zonata CBS 506.65 TaxID=1073090 RepID=A0A1L9SMT5_9EURO|nr:hypothetical protein ASPZODRAFT_158255 [Penicilliopsis zonata CBS 506.65]OJJ48579.1 hypothetical protein ASPZODRAFT_158255 [Penicilliopsis zonata CBS 506.65]